MTEMSDFDNGRFADLKILFVTRFPDNELPGVRQFQL